MAKEELPGPDPAEVARLLGDDDVNARVLAHTYLEDVAQRLQQGDKYTAAPVLLRVAAYALSQGVLMPAWLHAIAVDALKVASSTPSVCARIAGTPGASGRTAWKAVERNAAIFDDDIRMRADGITPGERETALASKWRLSEGAIRTILANYSEGKRDPFLSSSGRMLAGYLRSIKSASD